MSRMRCQAASPVLRGPRPGNGPGLPDGARTRTTKAPYLVAGVDHDAGVIVGQVQVAAKKGEVPAARHLLEYLVLAGAIVTMDATHTCIETAKAIIQAGGAYVFTGGTPRRSRL